MSEVSVLGCGRMGSALIEALAAADIQVTIWNRTKEKADALAGPQVTVADTVGEALLASPATIISISNYPDTRTLLEGHEQELRDATIVQLTSGQPAEAETLGEFVRTAGGAYVDGVVLAPPDLVGTDEMLLYCSGDPEAFDEIRSLLQTFGGTVEFVGEQPRAATVRELALLSAYTLAGVGLRLGAMICEREDLPLDWYVETERDLIERGMEAEFQRILDPDAPTDPAEIEDPRLPEGMADTVTYFRSVGIDPRVPEAIYEMVASGWEDVPKEPGP